MVSALCFMKKLLQEESEMGIFGMNRNAAVSIVIKDHRDVKSKF